METAPCSPPTAAPPDQGGRFARTGLLVALIAAPVFGLIWAWVAEVAQAYFAPLVLFPLLLGAFVGFSIVGLVRFAEIGHRPTIVLVVALAALVAAAGQHYFSYLVAYHWFRPTVGMTTPSGQDVSALAREMMPRFGEFLQAQARRGRPMPWGFVAQGGLAWLTWAIDALLTLAAAVAVVLPAMQVPYCNGCKRWYRTIRHGKIDRPTAERLAELIGTEPIGQRRSPRYRLSACPCGGSPTRCELSWEEADGTVSLVRAWLDPAARNQAAAILDEVAATSDD